MAFIIFPIHFTLQILNLALWSFLVVTAGILKFLIPIPMFKRMFSALGNTFYYCFGITCVGIINWFNKVEWDYQVDGKLNKDGWYLLIANHLSYLDIILLIQFAVNRLPPPRFFLKKELIWMPFVGIAAWALEMPFMRRYSREFVKKNPHLKGKDIETTRKHCEKFKEMPTTVINFVEGTRFSETKHNSKKSQFTHLLPPKAGGIAFTLAAMGEMFDNMLDVTILYPENTGHVMMDLLSGRLKKVIFHVTAVPIPKELIGDYFNDEQFRETFQDQLNTHWQSKDKRIAQLLEQTNA